MEEFPISLIYLRYVNQRDTNLLSSTRWSARPLEQIAMSDPSQRYREVPVRMAGDRAYWWGARTLPTA
jgi:hypothetical protein